LVALARRFAGQSERVRLEDALKHLHGMEASGRPASLESVAGALGVSRARAYKLVAHLEARGLARADGAGFPLTDAGRDYALRVVRAHRLWERYLADRTGVAAVHWHADAERKEHELSPNETESLDERMGRPMYDPHGDPIPTAEGELPQQGGRALSSLSVGDAGIIVHLEDEPPEAYEKLLAAGLSPGMPIEVTETEPTIRFIAGAAPGELSPMVAANVTVAPVAPRDGTHTWTMTLAEVGLHDRVRVIGISPSCQGAQRRRLLDLGVVPGTIIEVEMMSASGDPVAYRIRGAVIALRRSQAEWIRVEPVTAVRRAAGATVHEHADAQLPAITEPAGATGAGSGR
jgi:DtxR family Mn-dependent transcriptional regulator